MLLSCEATDLPSAKFVTKQEDGDAAIAEVAQRACETQRERRYETVGKFYQAWSAAAGAMLLRQRLKDCGD
jgi:hypothetical protein